jgi:hypothetical protein
MKIRTTMTALVMAALAATTVACSAAQDGSDALDESQAENLGSTEQALINNGGGTRGKSKADLLADGYTCTTLSGTTVTLCWKNGSPGYTCNDRGTCTQNAKPVAPPIITLPPRSPGVVLAP